jgi:hypothetical protein
LKDLKILYNFYIRILLTSILTGALLFWNCTVSGQNRVSKSDSLVRLNSELLVNNDTIIQEKASVVPKFTNTDSNVKFVGKRDSMRIYKEHSPTTAGMYSAVIPGLGQAYNHKYWKIPVLYVGEGFMLYYGVQQQKYYKQYKNLYEQEYYSDKNADSLNIYGLYRDGYRKNRDRLFFFAGLIYAASIIDAMVDAYFYSFDISDKLAMKVEPEIDYPVLAIGNFSYGLKLSFKF